MSTKHQTFHALKWIRSWSMLSPLCHRWKFFLHTPLSPDVLLFFLQMCYSSFSRCVTPLSPDVLLFFHGYSLSLFSTATTMTKSTYIQVEKVIFPKVLDLTCLKKQTTTQIYQDLTTWPESRILIYKKKFTWFFRFVFYMKHKIGTMWENSQILWGVTEFTVKGSELWSGTFDLSHVEGSQQLRDRLWNIVKCSGYSDSPRICQNQLEGALKNFHYHTWNVRENMQRRDIDKRHSKKGRYFVYYHWVSNYLIELAFKRKLHRVQVHLIISLKHRGQCHLSIVYTIHFTYENGWQETKLISTYGLKNVP